MSEKPKEPVDQASIKQESRLADLEMRIAFQEDAIDQLSQVIAQQDKALMEQEKMIKYLYDQLKKSDVGSPISNDDQPPPHY